MAHLIKPWIVRYVDAHGRQGPKDTSGAKRVEQRAKKWYGQGVPGWPRSKRVPLATHKATAQALLNRMVEEVLRGNAGLSDRYREHRTRPLAEHLNVYRRELATTRGATARHVAQTCSFIKALMDGCEFETTAHISSEAVVEWLAELRRDKEPAPLPPEADTFTAGQVAALLGRHISAVGKLARRHRIAPAKRGRCMVYARADVERLQRIASRGASVRTANDYLEAFQAFCQWLVDDKRMAESPVARLKSGNENLDRRHHRREVSVAEITALFEATRASPVTLFGLSGEDRYHLYLCACGTGFRAGELAALAPESFDLRGVPATVTLPIVEDKSRRGARQPLPPQVAAALRGYLAGRPRNEPVWPSS
jgi:hypothetical protein